MMTVQEIATFPGKTGNRCPNENWQTTLKLALTINFGLWQVHLFIVDFTAEAKVLHGSDDLAHLCGQPEKCLTQLAFKYQPTYLQQKSNGGTNAC
jgi:hypothetical protein